MQDGSDTALPRPLIFDGPMAIVGGGRLEPGLLGEAAGRGVHLVGADGGADAIARAGLVPEAIVGDLDSLADRPGWEARTRVVHLREQATTDFEKAIYSTRAPVTIALGMTGGRFDHTLASLHTMARYARERAIVLVGEEDVALALGAGFAFATRPGERVSIHPLTPVRFARSEGLAFPLEGLSMAPGEMTGVSNAATGARVAIEVEAGAGGVWLLILGRDRLWDLVDRLALGGWPARG